MLMHRAAIGVRRGVRMHVRAERVLQGAAAGRDMAVPGNWRAMDAMGEVVDMEKARSLSLV